MSDKGNWYGGPDLVATERGIAYELVSANLDAALAKLDWAKNDLDQTMRGFDRLGDVQQSRDVASIYDELTELDAKLEAVKATIF